jgi:hypothetical protein
MFRRRTTLSRRRENESQQSEQLVIFHAAAQQHSATANGANGKGRQRETLYTAVRPSCVPHGTERLFWYPESFWLGSAVALGLDVVVGREKELTRVSFT